MKFFLAITAVLAAYVNAFANVPYDGSIKADSALGTKLLSHARLLNEEAVEATWVAGYSLKFQGCYNVKQWNEDADENNDVRIMTKSLVRFRLCPSSGCSAQKAAGCTSGYGDYIIDMKTFIKSYYEVKKQLDEENCATMFNNCDCANAENQEYCQYDCAVAAEMTQCVDRNPYEEGEGEAAAEMAIDNYLECGRLEGYQANNGGNQGNGNENAAAEEEAAGEGEEAAGEGEEAVDNGERLLQENQYFLGPYCANQGGAILMGLFTEDTCTQFADETAGKTVFTELTGQALPFSDTSIVGMDCISCLGESNEEEVEGEVQEGAVGEQCAILYSTAGKCESSLPDGIAEFKNTNGCSFIDGIKIIRTDGIVSTNSRAQRNPVATAFIVVFAMLFCAMGFYVWYLRKRIGVKKDSLL